MSEPAILRPDEHAEWRADKMGKRTIFESSRLLIAELYLPVHRLMNYYGMDAAGVVRGAQLPFNFHLIGAKWQARVIDQLVREYEAALPPGASRY